MGSCHTFEKVHHYSKIKNCYLLFLKEYVRYHTKMTVLAVKWKRVLFAVIPISSCLLSCQKDLVGCFTNRFLLAVIPKGPYWLSFKKGLIGCFTKRALLAVITGIIYQKGLVGCHNWYYIPKGPCWLSWLVLYTKRALLAVISIKHCWVIK